MGPVFGHGQLRLYLLALLEVQERSGYDVIRGLEERFGGLYSPSAGTIYPRLAKLEEEGLVERRSEGRRSVYRLTDAGREELDQHRAELRAINERLEESARRLAEQLRDDLLAGTAQVRARLEDAARHARAAAGQWAASGGFDTDRPHAEAHTESVATEAAEAAAAAEAAVAATLADLATSASATTEADVAADDLGAEWPAGAATHPSDADPGSGRSAAGRNPWLDDNDNPRPESAREESANTDSFADVSDDGSHEDGVADDAAEDDEDSGYRAASGHREWRPPGSPRPGPWMPPVFGPGFPFGPGQGPDLSALGRWLGDVGVTPPGWGWPPAARRDSGTQPPKGPEPDAEGESRGHAAPTRGSGESEADDAHDLGDPAGGAWLPEEARTPSAADQDAPQHETDPAGPSSAGEDPEAARPDEPAPGSGAGPASAWADTVSHRAEADRPTWDGSESTAETVGTDASDPATGDHDRSDRHREEPWEDIFAGTIPDAEQLREIGEVVRDAVAQIVHILRRGPDSPP